MPTQAEPHKMQAKLAISPMIAARYVVVADLGEGGMSRVYRAWDTRLHRTVALKVLKHDLRHVGMERTMREALAMARLSHANVLPIFDVVSDDDRLLLVMELVEGHTLRQWLAEGARSPREIARMFSAAGRGLAAAHAAGLVHRDFKPDNVLVGDDGRVRVMDFGLVRDDSEQTPATFSAAGARASGPDALTADGVVLGTPAYMSPEQHDGHELVEARTDQYAFCVALYEALYGRRPFVAPSTSGLVNAKLGGPPRDPPRRGVPARLHRIICRGLEVDPAARHASMSELVVALERFSQPSSLRGALLTVCGGAIVGAAIVTAGSSDPGGGSCEGIRTRDYAPADTTRAQIEAAFLATEIPYAADTWSRVDARLTAYGEALASEARAACEATHVDRRESATLLDARTRCVQDRKRDLDALVGVLESADATTLDRSLTAVGSLPDVSVCADPTRVGAGEPPPPSTDLEDAVAEIQARRARAEALELIGRTADAETLAADALRSARELGWDPLVAEAQSTVAGIHETQGDYERGLGELKAAHALARKSGADRLAADIGVSLVFILSERLTRPDEALTWVEIATAEADRFGDAAMRERLATHTASVYAARGELDAAIEVLEAGLRSARERGPIADQMRADLLARVATIHADSGRIDEALRDCEEALEIHTRLYGPDHPRLAALLHNMGGMFWMKGDDAAAETYLERSLKLREAAQNPDPARIAKTLSDLGRVAEHRGQHERAIELVTRAVKLVEGSLGPEHPQVAMLRVGLGTVQYEGGDHEAARRSLEVAIPVLEAAFGPQNVRAADARLTLASSLQQLHEPAQSRAELERARKAYEATFDADDPRMADVYRDLGDAYAALGDRDTALADHRKAAQIQATIAVEPEPEPEPDEAGPSPTP